MNKLLTLSLLSFTIACSVWAEKYEYVRLKMKSTTGETFTYNSFTYHVYDSVSLESGDIARLAGLPDVYQTELYFDDGEDVFRFDMGWNSGGAMTQTIVGPGTIYLASTNTGMGLKAINLSIQRASDTGSTTLAWNGTEWEGSNDDGSQNANNNSSLGGIDPTSIKYDELLGWAWFTDTNWVYSYTNLSWYYMHPTTDGFYVWNANLPDNGWMRLERG